MSKNIKNPVNHINNIAPKYPRDTQFLAQYFELANQCELTLETYSLYKVGKVIKLLENIQENQLLKDYYYDLTNSIKKISDVTNIPEPLIFLDFHRSLVLPTITSSTSVTILTMDEVITQLASMETKEEKRILLRKYYNQYFSKL